MTGNGVSKLHFLKNNAGLFKLFNIYVTKKTMLLIPIGIVFGIFGYFVFFLVQVNIPARDILLLSILLFTIFTAILYLAGAAYTVYFSKADESLEDFKEQQIIEQLHITNQKLNQANEIIEKSAIMIFDWSLAPGTPVKYVSNNIKLLLGYEPDDFYTGKIDFWDIVHPDDLDRTQDTIWQTRNTDVPSYSHQYRFICKNGEIRWVEEWTSLERDPEGNLIAERGVIWDITEQKLSEQKIKHLNIHDSLTDLYNRSYFEDALKEFDNPKHYPLSLIIGDMNGLKNVNDTYGSKTGDKLLISAAEILIALCPKDTVISRIGGNEFALILQNKDIAAVSKLCTEIRQHFKKFRYESVEISMALGYATKTDSERSIEELLIEAEDNMYKNKLNQTDSIRSGIITSLTASLEEKTMETKEHGERLKELSLRVGNKLGFVDSVLDELCIASVMHDIGKLGIPDSILLKEGKLSPEEWSTMKKHTEIGYHIFLSSPKLASIASYILSHHERWDGKGYPNGLVGETIPLVSRIISIADAYDVMTHDRPYSKAIAASQAVEELIRCAGTQFDPHLVKVFCEVCDDKHNLM